MVVVSNLTAQQSGNLKNMDATDDCADENSLNGM
jgi:hypothetical protein